MELPHTGVFTRLQPSTLHGVGVFAILDIPKGAPIFKGDENSPTVEVPESVVTTLPEEIQRLYKDFCPLNNGIYTCPPNFNQMSISWFLNESQKPNAKCGDDLIFYANQDIKAGEELTVDYSSYSE
jgi:hypothetical protein